MDVSVPFGLAGTAVSGSDYILNQNAVVMIPAGQPSGAIRLTLLEDAVDEADETIRFVLGAPTNAVLGTPSEHVVTLQDNDPLPVVFFSSPAQSAEEDAGTVSVEVLLSAVSSRPITVSLVLEGTAIQYNDYTTSPVASLVIPAGSVSAPLNIHLTNDTLQETSETIIVGLGQIQNAVAGTPASHIVTILINDQPTCDIFTGNELVINASDKRVAWTLSNLGQDALLLKSITVSWPTNVANPPKFDLVKIDEHLVWDDNKPHSPATANAPWIGFDYYRALAPTPSTFSLYFTRTLLAGNYHVSFIFHNVTRGVDCSPVEKSAVLN